MLVVLDQGVGGTERGGRDPCPARSLLRDGLLRRTATSPSRPTKPLTLALSAKSAHDHAMEMANILSVLIGVVVGAAASYLANLRLDREKSRKSIEEQRKNLRLVLKLELVSALKGINDLKRSRDERTFFMLRWVGVIREAIKGWESQRSRLHLLRDAQLQELLINLMTELELFSNDIHTTENWQLDLDKSPPLGPNGNELDQVERDRQQEIVKEQRRIHLIELMDLRRRLEEAIRLLG
jgi:hypothetical protein